VIDLVRRIGYVLAERLTGVGNHFRSVGGFPHLAVLHDVTLTIGKVSGGTVGDLSFQAALVGGDTPDAATMSTGVSIIGGSNFLAGVQRIIVAMGVDDDYMRLVLPVGIVVTGSRRVLVINFNLETVGLADVVLAVRVDVDDVSTV